MKVEFVQRTPEVNTAVLLGAAEADISLTLKPTALFEIDAGRPVVLLAGAHVGCYELFTPPRIRGHRPVFRIAPARYRHAQGQPAQVARARH